MTPRAVAALLVLAACSAPPEPVPLDQQRTIEAISLLGDTLYRPELSNETLGRMEMQLDSARRMRDADTTNADAHIWFGRRLAYPGRYRMAITVFTDGMKRFPDDPRFLRHRGHRWITVRQLDSAVTDLTKAAAMIADRPDEIEPDGQPNARNLPTSSLHSNIWYHLGLAHYLKGNWAEAIAAYRHDAAAADNPDNAVAVAWWRWLTLRRLGDTAAAAKILAPITADMDIIENQSYHRLLRLAKGELPVDSLLVSDPTGGAPADAAMLYGVGAWHLVHGRTAQADSLFRRVLTSRNWASFGVIAAEAELARAK